MPISGLACLFVDPGETEISLLILSFFETFDFCFSREAAFLTVFSFLVSGLFSFLIVVYFLIDLIDYFDILESSPLGLYSGSVSHISAPSDAKLSSIELILLAFISGLGGSL